MLINACIHQANKYEQQTFQHSTRQQTPKIEAAAPTQREWETEKLKKNETRAESKEVEKRCVTQPRIY